jgi:thymidine kinase
MGEFEQGFTFYVGNMFGGKTASMIMDLQKAEIAGKKVQAVKVSWDDRYQDGIITANNRQLTFPAISIPDVRFLEGFARKGIEVLGIDELQFFDERIIDFIKDYKDKIKIIGTALQFDYRGNPFSLREVGNKEIDSKHHVGDLMALAYSIIHKLPVCAHKVDINGKRCTI